MPQEVYQSQYLPLNTTHSESVVGSGSLSKRQESSTVSGAREEDGCQNNPCRVSCGNGPFPGVYKEPFLGKLRKFRNRGFENRVRSQCPTANAPWNADPPGRCRRSQLCLREGASSHILARLFQVGFNHGDCVGYDLNAITLRTRYSEDC